MTHPSELRVQLGLDIRHVGISLAETALALQGKTTRLVERGVRTSSRSKWHLKTLDF